MFHKKLINRIKKKQKLVHIFAGLLKVYKKMDGLKIKCSERDKRGPGKGAKENAEMRKKQRKF